MSATRDSWPTTMTTDEYAELVGMTETGLVRLVLDVDDDGKLHVAVIYNEAEVDRRLEVLERAGVNPEVLQELREWHRVRREILALKKAAGELA